MSAFACGPVESQSPHGSRRSRDFDVVEHDLCVSIGGESDTARREGRVVGLSHLLTIYEEREVGSLEAHEQGVRLIQPTLDGVRRGKRDDVGLVVIDHLDERPLAVAIDIETVEIALARPSQNDTVAVDRWSHDLARLYLDVGVL